MPMTKFERECQQCRIDPTASVWLKDAMWDLQNRDPADALNDAEFLHAAMLRRWRELVQLHGVAPKV